MDRGITNKTLWKHYEIGYCDGSQLKKAFSPNSPNAEKLKALGILNEKGNESFYKCITFPIRDEEGKMVGMYGRSIEGKRQMYLKGQHRGVWNLQALKGRTSVMITESIIDALSLIQLGFPSVIPLYGVNGYSSAHREVLEQHDFKEVTLALDNDEAGWEGVKRFRDQNIFPNVALFSLQFPEGIKDPNDFLANGGMREDLEDLLKNRINLKIGNEKGDSEKRENGKHEETDPDKVGKIPENSSIIPENARKNPENGLLHRNGEMLEFEYGGIGYVVRGFMDKNRENLRVILGATQGKHRHTDRIDLYLSRSRKIFSSALGDKLGIQPSRIEEDLLQILGKLEEMIREKPNYQKTTLEEKTLAVQGFERKEVEDYLRKPKLLDRIVEDIEKIGYVGQDQEKLLCYLSALSRITSSPIHISIKSSSSAGKSDLMEKVASMFPPESVEYMTFLSPKSLYYIEGGLKNKMIIVDEKAGSEGAEYPLRSLMSRGKLSLATVVKDPETGRSKTSMMEIEGPCVVWDSSSQLSSEDNQNRVFEISLDESPEQTRKIHEMQKLIYNGEGKRMKVERDRRLVLHRNIHRVLKPMEVRIPFLIHLDFADHCPRTRRDFKRHLDLVAHITLLHQYQRSIELDEEGKEILLSTVEDYRNAYEITCEILQTTYSDLNQETEEFFIRLHAIITAQSEEAGVSWKEYRFSRRQVRQATQHSEAKVRRCMRELSRLEFVICSGKGQGSTFFYNLVANPEELKTRIEGITTPKTLEDRLCTVRSSSLRQTSS